MGVFESQNKTPVPPDKYPSETWLANRPDAQTEQRRIKSAQAGSSSSPPPVSPSGRLLAHGDMPAPAGSADQDYPPLARIYDWLHS